MPSRKRSWAFILAVSALILCMAVHVGWFAIVTVRPDLFGITQQVRQLPDGAKEHLVTVPDFTWRVRLFWLLLEAACTASAIYVLLAARRPGTDDPASWPSENASRH